MFLQFGEGLAQIVAASLREVVVNDIADAVGHDAVVGDAGNLHALSFDRKFFLFAGQQFLDPEPERSAGRSLEPFADFAHVHAPEVLSVHGQQSVAGNQAGPVGGEAFVGPCDGSIIAAHADQRSDASVFSGGLDFEVGHLLLGNQLRVGIELSAHPVGGCEQQFFRIDRIDIAEAHVAEHVEQDPQIASQREVVAGRRRAQHAERGRQNCREKISGFFRYAFHRCFHMFGTDNAADGLLRMSRAVFLPYRPRNDLRRNSAFTASLRMPSSTIRPSSSLTTILSSPCASSLRTGEENLNTSVPSSSETSE